MTEGGHWPNGAAGEFLGQLDYHRAGPWALAGPGKDDDIAPYDCILAAPIAPVTTAH